LPTARYVPNARSRKPSYSNPDEAAANAASIRRHQSDPKSMSGVSTPPPDDATTPTRSVQYSSQPFNPAQSAAQPSQNNLPASRSTRQTSQDLTNSQPTGNQNNSQSSFSGTYGQQYPQPNTSQTNTQPAAQPAEAAPAPAVARTRPRPRRPAPAASTPATPQPASSGLTYPGVSQPLGYQPYPTLGPAYQLPAPPSDAQLVAKSVPPLRGAYSTSTAPEEPPQPLSERQQTERDLAALEASYSGWLGGTGYGRYRSGRVGLDRLTDLEASAEASAVVGNSVRLTVVPTAVFLNSGQVDPTVYTGSGTVLGSFLLSNANAPQQQYASGIGGELQIATPHFAFALGYTPYEFLVSNVTGRLSFQPTKHFTFYGERESVKETQLSYAGLRDPGSTTPVFPGNIWGGVISTGGGIRFDTGDERSGFYILADGADITGVHVLENTKFEGSMGAYFLVHTFPGHGKINVGASLFGEHYANNQIGETYGLGGYFSPQSYFLAAIPVTFTGYYKSNFHYNIAGSIGLQSFVEENADFFPLDPALQTAFSSNTGCTLAAEAAHSAACAQYPVTSSTGLNYGLNAQGAYRLADRWFLGAFLSANNTNNYNTISGGFFLRYMFRQQYPVENYPTGLFPTDGFRPLRVP
jgi:hypothetical protein